MKLELKQLIFTKPNINNEYVNYQKQLQPRMCFGNEFLENLFKEYKEEILTTTEKEISDYVNDDFSCNDAEDMFPRRCCLTGEWYIGEINFSDIDDISIRTRFIGSYSGITDDYLGLEVIFYYDEKTKKLISDNNVNSEAL